MNARQLDKAIRELGFVLVREKRHRVYKLHGNGPILVTPKTPSDVRGSKNDLARARRIAKAVA